MKKRKNNKLPVDMAEPIESTEATVSKTGLLKSPEIHIIILIVLAILTYSNTFHVPFILDDEGSIQLNEGIHGLRNFFFKGGYTLFPNRVLGYLSFALNFQFSGLDVTSYHIVNLVIHIVTAQLVYAITRLTFMTSQLKHALSETEIGLFAFVVALLFAIHPVQTQAVTYIVQRLSSLCTLLYLSALICYVRWRLQYNNSAGFMRGIISPWYAVALVAAVLAMKTKEIAFTLPVIILLYEYTFFGWPGRKLLGQMVPLLLTIAVIPCTVFFNFNHHVTSGGTLLSDVNAPVYNVVKITRWEYLYTQFSVVLTYLRLLILPIKQNLDYDYPINRTLADPKPLLSLLALLLLFALAVYLFMKSGRTAAPARDEKERSLPIYSALLHAPLYRLAAFGIFWFFITLSVESSIIVIQDVIFEHRLYLPSFGFFLSTVSLGALGVSRLAQRRQYVRTTATALVATVVLAFSAATFVRNGVWHDWISIWSDAVLKSPTKPRAHLILGIGHYYLGNTKEALQEYQQAAALKPDYIEAYYNIGLVYKTAKQHAEAINMFQKVLAYSAFKEDLFARVNNEIGISYAELGEYDKAIKALEDALKYQPDSIDFRNNYAFTLSLKGDKNAAIKEYQNVLSLNPGNAHATEMLNNISSNASSK